MAICHRRLENSDAWEYERVETDENTIYNEVVCVDSNKPSIEVDLVDIETMVCVKEHEIAQLKEYQWC